MGVCGGECVWVGVCVGRSVCGWSVCGCVCVGEQTKVPYSITKVNMFSFNNTVISMATNLSMDSVNNIYLCYILNGHIPSSHVTCSRLHSNPPLHSG